MAPQVGFDPRNSRLRQPTRIHSVLIASHLRTKFFRAASARFAPRRGTVEGQSGTCRRSRPPREGSAVRRPPVCRAPAAHLCSGFSPAPWTFRGRCRGSRDSPRGDRTRPGRSRPHGQGALRGHQQHRRPGGWPVRSGSATRRGSVALRLGPELLQPSRPRAGARCLPALRRPGLGFMAFSPLAGG